MSLHAYTRSGLPTSLASAISLLPADAPLCIVGHGAGGPHWGRSHPIVQLGLVRAPLVLSLQLPKHGNLATPAKDAFRGGTKLQKQALVRETLEQIYQLLVAQVRGRHVLFIGYSTSGLLFMKLFDRMMTSASLHPLSMLVCVGTALCIHKTQSLIQTFWKEETFEADPRRLAVMRAMHRPKSTPAGVEDDESWRNTVGWVRFAAAVEDSGLFTTVEDRQKLFQAPVLTYEQRRRATSSSPPPSSRYAFYVQGSHDEPFPPEDSRVALRALTTTPQRDLVAERLHVVDGATHFNLFTPQKQDGRLEQVLAQINRVIDTYGELNILQRVVAPPAARPAAPAVPPPIPSAAPSAPAVFSPRRVVIIGSGVFGVSTARTLSQRYPDAQLIMLEKSIQYPPPLGASNDMNRIVRSDYGDDQLYTQWALDSIRGWHEFNQRHGEEVFKQTGVLFLADASSMEPPAPNQPPSYEYASYTTLQAPPFSIPLMPLRPATVTTPSTLQKHFPFWQAPHVNSKGYFNPSGGYVDAARALALTIAELKATNPRFELRTGAHVTRVETEVADLLRRRCTGVTLASGEFITADLVIAAAGCWTTELIPELRPAVVMSAQPLIYVRPGNSDVKANPTLSTVKHATGTHSYSIYQDAPAQAIQAHELSIPAGAVSPMTPFAAPLGSVVSSTPFPVFSGDLSRLGWYGFAENDQHGLVKIGHHGPGVTAHLANGPDARRVLGADELGEFTTFLREQMPQLWQHGQLVDARTCWYTDTFDGHFLVDYHPHTEGLFVATGGCGHAFKFAPVLGDVVVNILASRASPATAAQVPPYASRFRWRLPSADTLATLDVCRSVVAPTQAIASASHEAAATSRFEQSVRAYLRATGQDHDTTTSKAKL